LTPANKVMIDLRIERQQDMSVETRCILGGVVLTGLPAGIRRTQAGRINQDLQSENETDIRVLPKGVKHPSMNCYVAELDDGTTYAYVEKSDLVADSNGVWTSAKPQLAKSYMPGSDEANEWGTVARELWGGAVGDEKHRYYTLGYLAMAIEA
jgi:hypothetical protein